MALIPSTNPRAQQIAEEQEYQEYLEYLEYLNSMEPGATMQAAPETGTDLIPSRRDQPLTPEQIQRQSLTDLAQDPQNNPLLIGAGREFTQMGRGVGNMFDIFRKAIATDPEQQQRVQQSMQQREQRQEAERPVYEALREEAPFKTFLGEMSPWALSPLGPTAGARRKLGQHQAAEAQARLLGYEAPKMGRMEAAKTHALASPVVTGAVEGGVVGAIHPEMDTTTGAGFGAAGGWGGKVLGRMASSPYKHPSHSSREILSWADQNKLFTPPGLATGRGTLQGIDAAISTQRQTQQIYEDRLKDSAHRLNKLITDKLTSVGPDGKIRKHGVTEITPDWISHHTDRVGDEMDDLVKNTRFEPRQSAMNAEVHLQDALDYTTEGVLPIVKKKVARLKEIQELGGTVDGKEYQSIARAIRKGMKHAYDGGNADTGAALKRILDDMEVDIEASGLSDPKALERWRKARKDYAIVSAIEDSYARNRHKSLPASQGFIDYQKLGERLGKMDPDFDMVGRYANAMNHQVKASLSTSAEFGKTFNPFSTDVRAGPAMRLTGKTLNKLPFVGDEMNNMATRAYLTGWPYKRGVLGFDSPLARQGIESLLTRLGIGSGEKE
jgi:hypothetical protein